jgi:hypothetical protein
MTDDTKREPSTAERFAKWGLNELRADNMALKDTIARLEAEREEYQHGKRLAPPPLRQGMPYDVADPARREKLLRDWAMTVQREAYAAGRRAERDKLREELERERMRLAACGVVAMANTPGTAAMARDMHADYRSGSCDEVAKAVDREMALRAEAAKLKAERDAHAEFYRRFLSLQGDVTKITEEAMEAIKLREALREASNNMRKLMECEADQRDCEQCLARIDALLGDISIPPLLDHTDALLGDTNDR